MGCCQSKKDTSVKEPEVKNSQSNPEGTSLKHPQSELSKNHQDEESKKNEDHSSLNQPNQASVDKHTKDPTALSKPINPILPIKTPAPVQENKLLIDTNHMQSSPDKQQKKEEVKVESRQHVPAHNNNQVHSSTQEAMSNKKLESPVHQKHESPVHQKHESPVHQKEGPAVEAPVIPQKPASSKPFNLKAILDVFNDIRKNPSKYADRVQILYLDHINDNNVNMRTKIMTNEGKTPYIEAKRFLSTQKPIPKCELDGGLSAAAYLHSVYCAELDQLTHQGKGGNGPMDRIKVFGDMLAGMCAENILNRAEVTPEEWILDFVIDDGVLNRGHRKNIFNDQTTKVGLGLARKDHQSDWYFTMDFSSDGYKSDKNKIPKDVSEKSGLRSEERRVGKEC